MSRVRYGRPGRWVVPACLLAGGVVACMVGGTAAASDRDLDDARLELERAIPAGDDAALSRAAARLARAEPPRGALELVAELGRRDRRVALVIRDELSRAGDPRVARALAERLAALRDARARRLLADALGAVPGDEVTRALVRALDDREVAVRVAAARSLGVRGPGTAAIASGHLRARALLDPSPRVRKAAAVAGERLGAPPPPGFDVTPAALGLPSRFFARRVAFVVDASTGAREASFLEPAGLSPIAPVPSATLAALGTNARTKKPAAAPPRLVSAHEVASEAVAGALVRLADDQLFDLLVFNERTLTFAPRAVNANVRGTSDGRDWLLSAPLASSDERDVVRALERALDPPDAPGPDEVWLATTGSPAGRTAERAEAASALAERAWARDVPISVVLLETEPETPPRDERERIERARQATARRAFAEALAGPTGGRVHVVALSRPAPDSSSAASSPATVGSGSPAAAARKPLVPLSGGRVGARDLAPLRRRVDDALKAADDESLVALALELGAAPDPAAVELALRILLQGGLPAQLAALDGLRRNVSPRVHDLLARELRLQTDPGRAILLARALAVAPGPSATHALAAEANRRDGPDDLLRLLLTALADRPPDELAPIATEVFLAGRRAKGGLAALEARRALAIAKGQPVEPRPFVPDDRLLPEKFAARGVAFLIDTEAAMDVAFEVASAGDGGAGERGPRPAGLGKKPAPAPPAPARPATRRAVVAQEVGAALEVLAATKAVANILAMSDGGQVWRTRAGALSRGGLADARAFVAALSVTAERHALRPLERALDDPEVEEIWILVAGAPTRSDADRDPAAVRDRVRSLWLRRGVRVNVVLALGALDPGDPVAARAARSDELARLEAFWKPLASAAGGTLLVRERVRAEKVAVPETRRGGVAGVASPTPPRR